MHPHPEPLGDQLHQRRPRTASGRLHAARARTRPPRRSACAPAWARAVPAPAPASPPSSSARCGRIERRAREPERVRRPRSPARHPPAPDAPSRTSPAPDPARPGTPSPRTARRCTASGRGFKLRSARNACTFGSSPPRAIDHLARSCQDNSAAAIGRNPARSPGAAPPKQVIYDRCRIVTATQVRSHKRQNQPNIRGIIALTDCRAAEGRRSDRRARPDPQPGTGFGQPPAQRTGPRRPRPSTPAAASAARHPRSKKNTRSSPHVRRATTNTNSRPRHGWNGCVTRTVRCPTAPSGAVESERERGRRELLRHAQERARQPPLLARSRGAATRGL